MTKERTLDQRNLLFAVRDAERRTIAFPRSAWERVGSTFVIRNCFVILVSEFVIQIKSPPAGKTYLAGWSLDFIKNPTA
jgi:hypothetical protein